MFRQITAAFLILAVLSASFSRLFVYAGFELNKKYIATSLCINRDKPQLQCNGKCYLTKHLHQEDEKEKKADKNVQKTAFQDVFIVEQAITLDPAVKTIGEKALPELSLNFPQRPAVIFHPPKA
ncbi:hypothetical protein FW774_07015 [Pedobacter sp. BS3]|uniref:hypothetical protein n=1 Tax=Pedobacter sp. BS3 TaxID=2567937 RepID=UPI0011EBD33F|nr:hypothetical protein [Pedobacter sp. BS3]TZF84727.1 hypothetical protein FW774_07015 [Pedobacter sp. BS3]